MNSTLQWPALESDPNIFTSYFSKLGAKSISFTELLSLDYEEFLTVNGPVLGVILNFERGSKQTERKSPQILKPDSVAYFMKQTGQLDNACGLIAGIHVIGNNLKNGRAKLEANSILDRFFTQTDSLNFEGRAKVLEAFDEFKTVHSEAAELGQSSTTVEVKNHYICFIHHQNSIIELDGILGFPYIINEGVEEENFLKSSVEEIKRRYSNGEIGEGMNVMFMGNEQTNVTDLLG